MATKCITWGSRSASTCCFSASCLASPNRTHDTSASAGIVNVLLYSPRVLCRAIFPQPRYLAWALYEKLHSHFNYCRCYWRTCDPLGYGFIILAISWSWQHWLYRNDYCCSWHIDRIIMGHRWSCDCADRVLHFHRSRAQSVLSLLLLRPNKKSQLTWWSSSFCSLRGANRDSLRVSNKKL